MTGTSDSTRPSSASHQPRGLRMIAILAGVGTALHVAAAEPAPAHGSPFSFAALAGRTSAVNLVTATRLGACSAVSGQFSYLQHRIDPRYQQLVTVILDPAANSHSAIARYASRFDSQSDRWTMARRSSDASRLALCSASSPSRRRCLYAGSRSSTRRDNSSRSSMRAAAIHPSSKEPSTRSPSAAVAIRP